MSSCRYSWLRKCRRRKRALLGLDAQIIFECSAVSVRLDHWTTDRIRDLLVLPRLLLSPDEVL
jgi:hypothetical protein